MRFRPCQVRSTSRCVAVRVDGRGRLQSRQQRPLTSFFPEVDAGLVEQIPDGTVLDGELVIAHGGRLDFAALQRRLRPYAMHAARRAALLPATLVVFDLPTLRGEDLRRQPYWARREHLEHLLQPARPPLALMPSTRNLQGAVKYTPSEPNLVVEVDADVCSEQDRWRHATRFRRLRLDLQASDLGARDL
jgi:ATP-dependent DNA ligase